MYSIRRQCEPVGLFCFPHGLLAVKCPEPVIGIFCTKSTFGEWYTVMFSSFLGGRHGAPGCQPHNSASAERQQAQCSGVKMGLCLLLELRSMDALQKGGRHELTTQASSWCVVVGPALAPVSQEQPATVSLLGKTTSAFVAAGPVVVAGLRGFASLQQQQLLQLIEETLSR